MSKTLDLVIVNEAVDKSGLKKCWIANEIGVADTTLSLFLTGKRSLGRPAQILLARLLKIDEGALRDKAS